ncbi:MAG: M23 family metallopeptidase [Magnetococcales bacterium]|nr:M23 family metallopeptidase [Magnetococcales bacterium]
MMRRLALIVFSLGISLTVEAATLELSAPLEQGKAVFLRIREEGTPSGHSGWHGTIGSTPFPLTPEGMALVALDMEAPTGPTTIEVTRKDANGKKEVLTQKVTIGQRTYQEEHLTLPERRVSLANKEDEARVIRETEAIKATFAIREGAVGFLNGFMQPVTGRFSGIFGSRRILNGKPKRPHNGVDIAAPLGTPVLATADGRVVLVGRDYLLTGNTLVLHHGHGVISLYAHLDAIAVGMGDRVSRGQMIGKVGTTGRSTGPHLHWGTLVRGQRVDPMLLPGVVADASFPNPDAASKNR